MSFRIVSVLSNLQVDVRSLSTNFGLIWTYTEALFLANTVRDWFSWSEVLKTFLFISKVSCEIVWVGFITIIENNNHLNSWPLRYGTMLYHLSKQVNWELVILLLRNIPVKWWINDFKYMKIIRVNRGLRSEFESDLRSDEHYWSSYFKWLEVSKNTVLTLFIQCVSQLISITIHV